MCGIVGLIDRSQKYSNSQVLGLMADKMFTRGPDGYGEYLEGPVAMAMRRLSIIDLAHGWQPFFSNDDLVIAFQNGEIYNFPELRRELEQKGWSFKSHSDTEVLAHGFAQWGIDGLLSRIDGMYALAILDKRAKTLYLARDRFGEKPLFYACADGKFAYGSHLESLAMLPWVDDAVEPKALDYYLALHYVPGDMTFFKSVKRVLPGGYLEVPLNNPKPRVFRYYQPELGSTVHPTDDELAEMIERSVESRLIADVPVGVFLSGGLDSSIVAAVAAKKQPKILTFSMGFESKAHDESVAAALVAEAVGSTHHCFTFNENSFIDLLPKVAAALDEPVGDQAMLPLYWLCQEARKHVTVVLAGEGADEVFGGYFYYQRFLSDAAAGIGALLHDGDRATPSGFPLLSDAATRKRLTGHALPGTGWEETLLGWLEGANDPLQRATAADLTTWLPDDLLVKFDRMAMAHSLEGRAPYLHPDIVKTGLFLPRKERMDQGVSKIALRRIASKWLPQEILDRPKQGFVLPMKKWLQQWFEVHGSVDHYFAARQMPFMDMKETAKLVSEDVKLGVTNERFLFALVLLSEWFHHQREAFKTIAPLA